MTTPLQQLFPMIRTRRQVLADIANNPKLKAVFDGWPLEQQMEFLDCCTGVKGLHLLYDGIFKEIMNPEITPERLDEFLSLLLNQKVKVQQILSESNSRIADESCLVILDIIVMLEDGSYANLEVQRMGYLFPGQRAACYSADMLLRQYKKVRSALKKQFVFKEIKTVYTIILYERSPKEFKEYPDTYLHYFEQKSNTGLQMDLLQKYLFIPLDIFQKSHQNKDVTNRLEAWLTFFGNDTPEVIADLIVKYPDFKPLYEQAYALCRNTEEIMGFFSEELAMIDRNTERYMIDLMQTELDQAKGELDQAKGELDQAKGELDQAKGELDQAKGELDQARDEIAKKDAQLEEFRMRIAAFEKQAAKKKP